MRYKERGDTSFDRKSSMKKERYKKSTKDQKSLWDDSKQGNQSSILIPNEHSAFARFS
jgi:hypothetical protein